MTQKNILLLDIDNTILIPESNYIYKIINGKEIALSPSRYAKESKKDISNCKYDFRDFDDPEKILHSLTHGKPVLYVLEFMREKINCGWEIGILTARSRSNLIKNIMRSWLLRRDDSGKLVEVGKILKKVYAVGEMSSKLSTEDKKANVLKEVCRKYNKVMFIDDDDKNILAAKNLKLKNLIAINTELI